MGPFAKPMDVALPPELGKGAVLRDGEYAWELTAFPIALERAPSLGYACLGGQFWLLLTDNSVYEFFWLEANSSDRLIGEPWPNYAERSCREVLDQFNTLVEKTDFSLEVRKFRSLEWRPIDATSTLKLLFNADFVTCQEFSNLHLRTRNE